MLDIDTGALDPEDVEAEPELLAGAAADVEEVVEDVVGLPAMTVAGL